jgi:peptide/nickel transport system ATP-binding protein
VKGSADRAPVIELRGISKRFVKKMDIAAKIAQKLGAGIQEEVVHAVEDVSFAVTEGEVVGLVGESGCGKSTLGRIVAGILDPSAGLVLYRGQDVRSMNESDARSTALKIQMIFQDPFASLNSRMRVREIIGEAPRVHRVVKASELDAYLDDLMLRCGLDPSYKPRYPHQFSGGQRQRIAIARALAVKPEFIVCDEVVSALDVSIQAQILNLFMELRQDFGLTSLFISHDLGVVEHVSDRVVIMYLGRVVEEAETERLFRTPLHPYTRALLNEVPSFDKRRIDFSPIKGEIPSPLDPPSGCHFHPRCPIRVEQCKLERPLLRDAETGHFVACHLR